MRTRPLRRVLVAAALLAAGATGIQGQHQHDGPGAQKGVVPIHRNLGSHHYSITTRNPKAQRYFDQGLRLTWAFNHPEAIRSFEEGERLDSSCAMCAWGIAFASGPNINLGMDSAGALRAARAIERALKRSAGATRRERALIVALAARYASTSPERAAFDSAWARSIGEVADRFVDDNEAQVLHADALMNLSPWNYWTADGQPRPATTVMLKRLERVLSVEPGPSRRLPPLHPRRRSGRSGARAAMRRAARGADARRGAHRAHARAHLHPRRAVHRRDPAE